MKIPLLLKSMRIGEDDFPEMGAVVLGVELDGKGGATNNVEGIDDVVEAVFHRDT